MSGHANPYRSGLYNGVFGFVQKKQVVTRPELFEHTTKTLGKSEAAANAAVTVILSPRKSTTRKGCDCRGNMSSAGHLYYMEKLAREVKNGVKGVQRFRLRWRTPSLEARKRVEKIEVAPAKTATTAKVEVKAEGKQVVKA